MKKVFIDTSIFIRFLTNDIPSKFAECKEFFTLIKAGKIIPYTSNVVIMEIIFVLTRQYKFPKKEVLGDMEKLLLLRNLTVIESTDSKRAVELFEKLNIKYQDCLIVYQVPKNCTLVTYDEDFGRITSLSLATPKELIV